MTTDTSPSASANRPHTSMRQITALDGIRGTALLLVFCYHLFGSNDLPGHPLLHAFLKIPGSGWTGVDLFFALSGFLITGILFDSVNGPHYLKNFYIRRACRIFPLYYGFILLLFLTFKWIVPLNPQPLSLLPLYLQNTPLWWNSMHGGKVVDACSHLWSLAVEEQFYLVWPLVILLVRERRQLLWIAGILVCTAPVLRTALLANGSIFEATYKLTFCRMDSLLGGAWLALMVRGEHRRFLQTHSPKAFLLALAGCFAIAWKTGSFNWESSRSINQFGYTLLALAATSLIAMALDNRSCTARLMSAAPLRFVGRYSFGLYVYQPFISVLLGMRFAGALHRVIRSPLIFRLAFEATVLILTFAVALLSFRYFETRFLRLKDVFATNTPRPVPALSSSFPPIRIEDQETMQ